MTHSSLPAHALKADGCERILEDTISGAKSRRLGLDAALAAVPCL